MLTFFQERFGSGGFQNEQLIYGHIGQFLIVLSFFSVALTVIAYIMGEYDKNETSSNSWKRIARWAWLSHTISVIGIFVLLFLIILAHRFEYYYAWRHSSTDLPMKYMISCFWEGQEGSFLLWQFWHALIGLFLISRKKIWEGPVLTAIALVQLFLCAMVLGWNIGDTHIGINPFVLLRDELSNAPIFSSKDYLSFIKDGNGLNALLQNYWMVIHPPVLFLGFASTIVPFAFAIHALWKNEYKSWPREALVFSLFSGAALGTGVLMGGAWAYEALSFGGFWAWDPVENASLVPWLIGVAGLHTMLVFRNTGRGMFATLLFFLFSFLTVLYSTYLTRSGILGETSVHSFTDEGLNIQLLVFLLTFVALSLGLIIWRTIQAKIPSVNKEEPFLSREFWLFIGSLILLLSSVTISYTTSIPVLNIIFYDGLNWLSEKIAPPADNVAHYNSVQVWFGIAIVFLTALIQYFSYSENRVRKNLKWILGTFGVALVAGISVCAGFDFFFFEEYEIRMGNAFNLSFTFFSSDFCLAVAACYGMIGNAVYAVRFLKLKGIRWGSALAHLGLGCFLLFILVSQGKQYVISENTERVDFQGYDEKEKGENKMLKRGVPALMSNYLVTYTGKSIDGKFIYFNVQYDELGKDGKVKNSFLLRPYIQMSKGMQPSPNPDTKKYLSKDLFTHITSYSSGEVTEKTKWISDTIALRKDTVYTNNYFFTLDSLISNPANDSIQFNENLIGVGALFTVYDLEHRLSEKGIAYFMINVAANNRIAIAPVYFKDMGLSLSLDEIQPESGSMVISWKEEKKPLDFVIMKAIVFPHMNLLWLGTFLMIGGFLLSMVNRWRDNQKVKQTR